MDTVISTLVQQRYHEERGRRSLSACWRGKLSLSLDSVPPSLSSSLLPSLSLTHTHIHILSLSLSHTHTHTLVVLSLSLPLLLWFHFCRYCLLPLISVCLYFFLSTILLAQCVCCFYVHCMILQGNFFTTILDWQNETTAYNHFFGLQFKISVKNYNKILFCK